MPSVRFCLLAHLIPTAAALCTAQHAGTIDVVSALFGSESSRQAFSRQESAHTEVAALFPTRKRELTYGEFDLANFLALLDSVDPKPGEIFLDVGSGCGRLVLAASLAYPILGCSYGIELLPELHASALAAHGRLTTFLRDEPTIGIAPCELVCDEVDHALPRLFGSGAGGSLVREQPSVAFVYATCWPGAGPYLPSLTETLAATLAVGSRVVTIDKQLVAEDDLGRWRFAQVVERRVANYNTCESTAYVYRLEELCKGSGDDRTSEVRGGGNSARAGQVTMSATDAVGGGISREGGDAEADADGEVEPKQPDNPLLSTAPMRALVDAAAAQAEAAEAVGEAWDDIALMEAELAEALGVDVDELEAVLDGAVAEDVYLDDDDGTGSGGAGPDDDDSSLEAMVDRLKNGGGAIPEDLPYDVL